MSESNSFGRQLRPGQLKGASQFSISRKITTSACHMAATSLKNGVKASNQPFSQSLSHDTLLALIRFSSAGNVKRARQIENLQDPPFALCSLSQPPSLSQPRYDDVLESLYDHQPNICAQTRITCFLPDRAVCNEMVLE
jgi:hypothetical protein